VKCSTTPLLKSTRIDWNRERKPFRFCGEETFPGQKDVR
jgi:hypothetical protein